MSEEHKKGIYPLFFVEGAREESEHGLHCTHSKLACQI